MHPRYAAFEPHAKFGLAKFPKETVEKVLEKKIRRQKNGGGYIHAMRHHALSPWMEDSPLLDAVEAGNPWLVKWLVEQGEDTQPFVHADDLFAKLLGGAARQDLGLFARSQSSECRSM